MNSTPVRALLGAALLATTLLTDTGPAHAAGSGPDSRATPLPPAAPRLLAVAGAEALGGVEFHGRLYFVGDTPATGRELFVTDGTAAGTHVFQDLQPGTGSSNPAHLVVFRDRLFFTARDDLVGYEWFSTDGTDSPVALLTDIDQVPQADQSPGDAAPAGPVVAGGQLWFSANDGVHGRELWRTDGTAAGTLLVADLVPGASSSSPQEMTAYGDRVALSATNEQGAAKPYLAGVGTGVGELDSRSATDNLAPYDFTTLGGTLFFSAGIREAGQGVELWRSTGAFRQAAPVVDIWPGVGSGAPEQTTVAGARMYFRAVRPEEGAELWASDGTPGGTFLTHDLRPGPAHSTPTDLRTLGDVVIFNADDGEHGEEPYAVSDADPTRAVMLRDVRPGTVAGVLDHRDNLITTVAGRSLFTGDDGSGREPWVTDGTPDGTHRIADLNPGVVDSAPYAVGTLGDTVVLGATVAGEDRLYSWSPTWAPDPDPVTAAPRPSTTTAHPKRRYPAVRARHGKVVVPVTVAAADGSALSGGTVTVVLHGRVVGTAPLAGGTARVRITKHLRPHRRYVVTATWSGTSTTAGSSSAPFRVRVAAG